MEIRILFAFVRLMAAIAWEGITSLGHILLFLVHRRSERERVFELILHRGAKVASLLGVFFLAAISVLPSSGCSTTGNATNTGSATEVGAEETVAEASTKGWYRTSQPGSSYQRQCDEFVDTLEMLLNMDDAQGSLEDDLRTFGDSRPEELVETFLLLGW